MSNELVTMVNNNIEDMKNNEGLSLPPDYSVGNALNSAYLILSDTSKGQPLLDKCDQGSVIKTLMNMAIQGLSPAKNQCYFIPYGNQLVMQRSYFGSISVVKRLSNVKDIQAQVVHKDDTFKIGGENGVLVVKEFEPSFENLDKPIIGAFAWIEDINGNRTYTVMTKKTSTPVGATLRRRRFKTSSRKRWLNGLLSIELRSSILIQAQTTIYL
ncbi:Recombinational DNA repair protein RecT [Lactiplantibacillus plantarum]|uniref:Recombinational DNA repair protein RecT n=1 Tax=Lactiplantibacillus plantarum TaxID=1590 RepID=A0AAW3RDM8_LACPN|nr:Recombinational DNA repair protein RecT [Lactiplantibacillus plantarum]